MVSFGEMSRIKSSRRAVWTTMTRKLLSPAAAGRAPRPPGSSCLGTGLLVGAFPPGPAHPPGAVGPEREVVLRLRRPLRQPRHPLVAGQPGRRDRPPDAQP